MRLPAPSAHFSQRIRFGTYVARRLRRAKLLTLSTDAEKVTATLLLAGRALEDTDPPIQSALADRDAADDDLDDAAATARAKLAGRSADAARVAPYTLIFPEGVGYYTAAPLDEEQKRYGELSARLEAHLPPADKVRQKAVSDIAAGLDAFAKATADVEKTRTAQSLAATRLDAATEAWEKQMEKSYGSVVAELGRAAADRFFPRVRGKKNDAPESPATPEPKPA